MKKSGKWKVQFLVMAFCVFGLVAVLVGSSYAIFSDVSDQGDYNTVTAGTLQLSYEDTQSLSLSNLYPVSDVEGMTGEGYTFTVRNIGTLPSDYKVMIQDDEAMIQADGCSDHLMPKANIKISIDGGTPFLLSSIEESNYMITTGNLQPGESVTHVVKVWIDEASGNEILGTHFHGKVVVEGVQGEFVYQDESGANAPELVEGMIPVTYNGTNWVKADVYNEWYNYNNQKWANAVTVTEENRATYMSAEAGTVIPMDDINTMWVWIPRYEYMYTNLGDQYAGGTQDLPGEIKVNFLNGISSTPSDAANYEVHPAFTFGTDQLTGLWYGKFELGGMVWYPDGTCDDENCSTEDIVILPNETPTSSLSTRDFFFTMRSMQMNSSNPYGFSSEVGDLHMSKSSEWGAVAYLSQSKYGKYGNPNYEGADKEVAVNNCSDYITGIGGDTVDADYSSTTCTTNTYETAKGQTASTTGNITGVYDMSGGIFELMMSYVYYDAETVGMGDIEEKYYEDSLDIYNAPRGYAFDETFGWYNDELFDFLPGDSGIGSEESFVLRGASLMNSGIFSIWIGSVPSNVGSRAVYTP